MLNGSLDPRDYQLLDRAEGHPNTARRERDATRHVSLPRAAARAVELEMERGEVALDRAIAEILGGFRAALSTVVLTGDAFDDRQALDRAAYAHARTIRGWYQDELERLADEAVMDVLRAAARRAA